MSLTLGEYLSSLKMKRVAVVGIGVSNTPLIKRLLREGIQVTACDKKEQIGPLAEELLDMGAELRLGAAYMEGLDHDVIFRSPGIRPDVPVFLEARAKGSLITSEMEVFFQVCPCKIIGVTGSDGKTTTTTLISEMLKNAGYTVHLGGNIGKPLLADVEAMQPSDIAVLELSSFQLMTLTQSPQIAVMTNISPNHLDVHTSMEEYRKAKEAIFCYQNAEDIAVFNRDNDETLELSKKSKGEVILFSREVQAEGVFVKEGKICIADQDGFRELFATSDILIPGQHNVENYLAAIAAVKKLVPTEVMQRTAKTFPGVEHRIELVRTLQKVRYFNDSIASSPTRTIAGLRSFTQKVILIAGGYDKKIPFDELGNEICRHVKTVVLAGHTADKIRNAIIASADYQEGYPEILMASEFQEAVMIAHQKAEPDDVVMLSPACASFDQFSNFAERGNVFKQIVHSL
jgi:UDP-N-acetylmuramoylalanine--D-glutamate ligase